MSLEVRLNTGEAWTKTSPEAILGQPPDNRVDIDPKPRLFPRRLEPRCYSDSSSNAMVLHVNA